MTATKNRKIVQTT